MIASTIMWQSRNSARLRATRMRAVAASASGLADAAFLGGTRQHFCDEFARFFRCALAGVHHYHVDAASGGDLHDAAPHGTGTDDADSEIGAVGVKSHFLFCPNKS
jgi:hypothetical protein